MCEKEIYQIKENYGERDCGSQPLHGGDQRDRIIDALIIELF